MIWKDEFLHDFDELNCGKRRLSNVKPCILLPNIASNPLKKYEKMNCMCRKEERSSHKWWQFFHIIFKETEAFVKYLHSIFPSEQGPIAYPSVVLSVITIS